MVQWLTILNIQCFLYENDDSWVEEPLKFKFWKWTTKAAKREKRENFKTERSISVFISKHRFDKLNNFATIEKLKERKKENFETSCNINQLFTCSSISMLGVNWVDGSWKYCQNEKKNFDGKNKKITWNCWLEAELMHYHDHLPRWIKEKRGKKVFLFKSTFSFVLGVKKKYQMMLTRNKKMSKSGKIFS